MLRNVIIAVFSVFFLGSMAFGADDSQIFYKSMGPKLHYSLGVDNYTDRDGYEAGKSYWYGIGNGPLHVAINDKLDYYKINFSENVATLIFLSPALPIYDLIKRFHFDLAAETAHDITGMLTFETEIYSPVSLIVAGQFAQKGKNRVVVGGKVNYRANDVSVFYIPRMTDPEEEKMNPPPTPIVNSTVLVKVKFREFKEVWIDLDGFVKQVNGDSEFAQDFSPLGYSATVGYWKVWGKYGITPYFEGKDMFRTGYEIGLNADF